LDTAFYNDAIDADFGPNTDEAVVTYQTFRGLDHDGIIGPITWRSLRGELSFTGVGVNFFTFTVGVDISNRFVMGDYVGADGRFGPWSYLSPVTQSSVLMGLGPAVP